MSNPFVLCYVDEPFAYFTNQPLEKQWGDDWNDAPYEHNAGEPYSGEGWEIATIVYTDSCYMPPFYSNGSLNVQDINQKTVPWLEQIWSSNPKPPIYAGTTIDDFKKLIRDAGGKIYVEEEKQYLADERVGMKEG